MSATFNPDFRRVSRDDKYYSLTMFPYPSGYGLHVGHASAFAINDVNARYQMLKGKTVLNPMGFDSFGLPTENYALKVGKPAHEVTQGNIINFTKQIDALDMSFDPDATLTTSDPSYYKWTQWLFQQLYKEGLVYRSEQFVNWCPSCQTVLANDQVIDGACERCKAEVTQRKMPQWFVKTTEYADDLIEGLDDLDRPEHTKNGQRNRIGRSCGAEIDFSLDGDLSLTVFTTRVDTLYGVTAVVLAPENEIIDHLISDDKIDTVMAYRNETLAKTSIERQKGGDKKTGVFSGVIVYHPLTNKQMPVWFADYVLPDYATGSVMLVPAHDARDWDFAQEMKIPYITVLDGIIEEGHSVVRSGMLINSDDFSGLDHDEAVEVITNHLIEKKVGRRVTSYKLRDWSISRQRYWGCPIPMYYDDVTFALDDATAAPSRDESIVIVRNPEENTYLLAENIFPVSERTGLETYFDVAKAAAQKVSDSDALDLVDRVNNVTYVNDEGDVNSVCGFLFDLVDEDAPSGQELDVSTLSRIDSYMYDILVTGEIERNQEAHIIPEAQLPVILPLDVENYKPAGVSPLADHPTFLFYQVGYMLYRRECDTLDTFMDSAFYFLRYPDVNNDTELCGQRLREVIFPVDLYVGGAEHTVGHLLYSRFVMRFLYNIGYVSTPEPFQKLVHQGMLIGADGRKMSKRWGNVVDPLDVVDQYGSDVLRAYLLFMGPVEQDKIWDEKTLQGVSRFISRVDTLCTEDGMLLSERYDTLSDEDKGGGLNIVEKALHRAIKGVTEDMDSLKYNTVISKLMILVNVIYDVGSLRKDQYLRLIQLMAPITPALAEKKWSLLRQPRLVFGSSWPVFDEEVLIEKEITLAIQINGKMRGTVLVAHDATEDAVVEQAIGVESIARHIEGKDIAKIIFVPHKILNLIVK